MGWLTNLLPEIKKRNKTYRTSTYVRQNQKRQYLYWEKYEYQLKKEQKSNERHQS